MFGKFLQRALPPRLFAWGKYRRHAGWRPVRSRHHGLDRPLFVTLTSFPPRFATLHLTLESLLRQHVRADGVLLWIAESDMARLPRKVRKMKGVSVLPCADVRSYKKLVFALERHPDAFLVTADDDMFYPPDWLKELVTGVDPAAPAITCHRAHRIALDADGAPRPYVEWENNVQDAAARRPSTDLLAVGVGGVLYPPGSLAEQVTRPDLFMTLAPQADDLWFFCMGRLAGTPTRKVGGRFRQIAWPSTQQVALRGLNFAGGNDSQLRAILGRYDVLRGHVPSES